MDQHAVSLIENARKKVLVCATQCSGSKMLCSLLKNTGTAGAPEEHLYRWIRGEQTFTKAVDCCFENQVFGSKIMANYRANLEYSLKRIWNEAGKDTDFLSIMGDAIWIYLIRKDRLRQALSRYTKRVAAAKGINLMDFKKKNEKVVFDYYDIKQIIEFELNQEYLYWNIYFSNSGIHPHVVYFEEICTDPTVIVHILKKNGLKPDGLPKSSTKKESTKLNDLFASLYNAVDSLVKTSVSANPDILSINKALSETIDKEFYRDELSLKAIERNLQAAKMNVLNFTSRMWDQKNKWRFFDSSFLEDFSRLQLENIRH
jgi:LPS sulfotransferase NodH